MTIETKYNIGDEVWVLSDNKPTRGKVRYITINHCKLGNEPFTRITYDVLSYQSPYGEGAVFKTREELIKHHKWV